MRFRFWWVLAVFGLGCASPQVAVRKDFDFSKVRRVAVIGFSGPGGDSAADLFAQQLLGAGVDVIERQRLEAVLQEQRMGASGTLSPDTMKKLGMILGVDALFMGTVTAYSSAQNYLVYTGGANVVVRDSLTPISGSNVYSRGPSYSPANSEVLTTSASVGLAARMVDVETGTLLWAANQTYESFDVPGAMTVICSSFVNSLKPVWPQIYR